MAGQATISLCLISLNEEEFIGRALRQVRPFVDEIILVDGGSTDRTVAIAEQYDAKVIKRKWAHDFSKQRNIGLRQAGRQWILQMDPDETYPRRFLRSLQPLLRRAGPIDAFM